MLRLQLPFGAGYAGRLAASGKSALSGIYDSVAKLAELFERRPELIPEDTNFGEWAPQQLALFDENDVSSEPNPLNLIVSGFQFDFLAEQATKVRDGLDQDDDDRAVLDHFISLCETTPKWGPEHVSVTVKAQEREVEVMVMGEPDDIEQIRPQLEAAQTLDELTEVALQAQSTLAEKHQWYRCEETECCGKPGYLAPEVSALCEEKLGKLAVAHLFVRPSDEPPRPMQGMQIMIMGDVGDASDIQDLLSGLFGSGFPGFPGFPKDDGSEDDDDGEEDDDRGF